MIQHTPLIFSVVSVIHQGYLLLHSTILLQTNMYHGGFFEAPFSGPRSTASMGI